MSRNKQSNNNSNKDDPVVTTINGNAVVTRRANGLLATVFSVASMTFISRILGFARDMVIARLFGAAAGVDAFFVAFKIPNFMRRLFAEGAFSQAFVPILSQYKQQKTQAEVRLFLSHVSGVLASILFLITILAVIFSPWVIKVFAMGFPHDGMRFAMASHMLRLTFPYLLLISMTAMLAAILNTYDVFAIPAFTPVLLNICLIAAAFIGEKYFQVPIFALAWGVLIAGFVQLLFLMPWVWRKGLLVLPILNWQDPGVKRLLTLMLPALFGVSVAQLNLLIDTVFASFLPVGSVSWLYYSDRLMNFPLGVFAVAVSTVILPKLSHNHAEKSPQQFTSNLDWGIRMILLIGVPSMLGLAEMAGPLLATLFGYGKFTAHDVAMARLSLLAFSFGLPAMMLIKLLANGFYARQDIKTPVKIAVVAFVTNTILNFVLIGPLAHAGLALATSIAATLNAGLLMWLLVKRKIWQFQAAWKRFSWQLVAANMVMLTWLWWMHGDLSQWLAWHAAERAMHLCIVVGVAILLYGLSLIVFGFRRKDLY